MKALNTFILLITALAIIIACNSSKNVITDNNKSPSTVVKSDTVSIKSDKVEYEIIIIDAGFSNWLQRQAQPEGFYSQTYLENKNALYVIAWNQRVLQPQRFNPSLYEMQIDYQRTIDYGYDVNYKLYNYFIYFQNTYNQNLLGGYVPLN